MTHILMVCFQSAAINPLFPTVIKWLCSVVLAEPGRGWLGSPYLDPKLAPYCWIYWLCLATLCLFGKTLVVFKGKLIFAAVG